MPCKALRGRPLIRIGPALGSTLWVLIPLKGKALGGIVFKLSTLSFAYLHHFYPIFITFLALFVKGCGKKNHTGLYVGEWSENKCFHNF